MPKATDEMEARLRRAVRRYESQALTYEEVALLEGVKRATLAKRVRARGKAKRKPGWTHKLTKAEREQIRKDAERGIRVVDTAERLRVSPKTVSHYRKLDGITSIARSTKAPAGRRILYDKNGKIRSKWCASCEKRRTRLHWDRNRSANDGLQTYCRRCMKAIKAKRRAS